MFKITRCHPCQKFLSFQFDGNNNKSLELGVRNLGRIEIVTEVPYYIIGRVSQKSLDTRSSTEYRVSSNSGETLRMLPTD